MRKRWLSQGHVIFTKKKQGKKCTYNAMLVHSLNDCFCGKPTKLSLFIVVLVYVPIKNTNIIFTMEMQKVVPFALLLS